MSTTKQKLCLRRDRLDTESLLLKVRDAYVDPMWVGHTEVSKPLLREVCLALQDLLELEKKL